jgi:peptidoglycan/LPS O-acetylase OafA/YrhL
MPSPAHAPDRRPDVDALRVLASFLLLLFHVGMVFNPAPFFHVRNDEHSIAFLVLCGFLSLWHMPLFFLLAGWSAHASLRGRRVGGFLGERARKLLVPLVAGCILYAPVIKYLELRGGQDLSHTGLRVAPELQPGFRSVLPEDLPAMEPFDAGFLEFLPSFFTDLDRFSWSHLWFLAYLLTLTLVLLPLLVAGVRRAARPRSAAWRRGLVYAPLVPLVLVQVLVAPYDPGPYNLYDDRGHLLFFATFLLAGFAFARDPGLEAAAHAERGRALGLALAAALLLLGAVLGLVTRPPLVLAATAVAGWGFVVALLGFARVRVRRSGPRLRALARVAFPVYLLHQPVTVVLAAGIVELPLGLAAKFVLLLVGATALTLGLVAGLRHVAPLRPLFGLPAPPPRPASAGLAPGRARA